MESKEEKQEQEQEQEQKQEETGVPPPLEDIFVGKIFTKYMMDEIMNDAIMNDAASGDHPDTPEWREFYSKKEARAKAKENFTALWGKKWIVAKDDMELEYQGAKIEFERTHSHLSKDDDTAERKDFTEYWSRRMHRIKHAFVEEREGAWKAFKRMYQHPQRPKTNTEFKKEAEQEKDTDSDSDEFKTFLRDIFPHLKTRENGKTCVCGKCT
jgi:hypothetical protein